MHTFSDEQISNSSKLFTLKFLNKTESVSKTEVAAYTIIFVSFVLGLWVRMKGLGTWPLAVDEYFIVKSVENIMKYGIPHFEAGGYYTRGLIYQYLTAGLFALGVKAEFAARFWPVMFNIITIPALYLLARKVSNKLLAAIVVSIFCFSVWEIEMARFARMYTAFQAVFIWYLLNLYRYVVEENNSAKKWMYIISILAIFVHEACVFIAALNFVPFVWKRNLKIGDVIIAGLILFASYSFVSFDFRGYNNEAPIMPENIELNKWYHGPIWLPKILLTALPAYPVWIILFAIPLVISAFGLLKVFKNFESDAFGKFSAVLMVILPLLNLFSLTFFVGLILLLLNWMKVSELKTSIYKIIYAAFAVNLIYWFAFAFGSGVLKQGFTEASNMIMLKETIKVLFKYPNFDILTVYLHAIPLFTVMAAIFISINLFQLFREKVNHEKGKRFFYFIIFLLALATTLINTFYNETRYTFYFFPVVLLLLVLAIENISDSFFKSKKVAWASFGIMLIAFLVISEDFELKHKMNIDTREVNFRMNYGSALSYHYYNRWDFRAPAEIINKYGKPEDVVITTYGVIDYYLNDFDYMYNDYRAKNFKNITTHNGTKERWSNGNLIYTQDQLTNLLENSDKTIWIVTDNNKYLREMNFYNNYRRFLYYKTPEGKLSLYKISHN